MPNAPELSARTDGAAVAKELAARPLAHNLTAEQDINYMPPKMNET